MLNVKKLLTKILKIEVGSVSTSSTLTFVVRQVCNVTQISCTGGNVTASANAVFATIANGFRPRIKVEVAPAAGASRLTIDTDGTIISATALNNASLRFTATYIGGVLHSLNILTPCRKVVGVC